MMAAEIASIPAAYSHLCSIELYREADGRIRAEVSFMPPRLIETTGEEVPDRMQIIAGWLEQGAQHMREAWK
jgi:hypothetical protein